MTSGFSCQRRVEFRDTDAAGIAHFSVFFVWMEQTEHAALRHLGMSVMDAETHISWPRVSADCDYLAPVFFEEQLEIRVQIANMGAKSVTFEFDFHCGDRRIATGHLTTVCCRMGTEQKLTPIPIPNSIAEQLKQLM